MRRAAPSLPSLVVPFLVALFLGASCGGGDGGAPAAPTITEGFPMPSGGKSGIHLVWDDRSDDEDNFEVQRKTGAEEYKWIGTVAFNTNQFHDGTVTTGQTYSYQVRATKKSGAVSGWSNSVTVTAPPP